MNEIGSEFWTTEYKTGIQSPCRVYLQSGRTAIDFIIRDIKANTQLTEVAIPSYCCDSMIIPFIDNGIKVRFYRVTESEIQYIPKNEDAVLLIDYFGYENKQTAEFARQAQKMGKSVIYDATHCICGLDFPAKYVFCSFRKWTRCNSAVAIKRTPFTVKAPGGVNERYSELRDEAFSFKERFMNGEQIDKSSFLSRFSKAEEILDCDYAGYAGEPVSVSIDTVMTARRENALFLINQLESISAIRLWKKTIGDNDCPLFVPVLVTDGKRDELKKYLIENSIFCPVHWPLTDKHGEYKDIYQNELSLICDHRYTVEDMKREASAVQSFFRG